MLIRQTTIYLLLIYPFTLQASHILFVDETKRVEAHICPDSMNRLTVANDRITQIFGDEGTFESQNEENTGQIFLKPTLENGNKDLSLTIITEQGLTQDLILKPTAKTPTTIIIKGVKKVSEEAGNFPVNLKNSPFQAEVLSLLHRAINNKLPESEERKAFSRPIPEGYHLSYQRSFEEGGYLVTVFELENLTDTPIEVQEKIFYCPGDLAISSEKRRVAKAGKTSLYIVSRS